MGATRDRGTAGEAMAAAYLELRGCRLLGRNVRLEGVEVDVLASEGATRVLVEVKFRGRTDYGGAAAAVDPPKRARLLRAARSLAGPVRIDVVIVELTSDGAALQHYRNAVVE